MKQLMRNLKLLLVLFLIVSVAMLGGLVFQQYRSRNAFYVAAGENKAALRSRYAQAGDIVSSDGVALATSESGSRRYASDRTLAMAALHIVGDYTHNIDNTIEARYQGALTGSDRNLLHQFYLDFTGRGLTGDDVHLTIDSRLTKQAYQLMKGRRGAIVLLNYETGAILASVSSPSTSPQSVIDFKDIPEGSLFNRALRGVYAPGSLFKIVTASAWMNAENYDPERVVLCNGESTVSPDGANESGKGHGEVNLSSAFRQSCNVYFGEIGAQLGGSQLELAASRLGWLDLISVDKLNTTRGRIRTANDNTAMSWLAIGQPSAETQLSSTPLQLALLAGAIGNGGVMQTPHIIDYLKDPLDMKYQNLKPSALKTVMTADEASALEEMMLSVVNSGTGRSARVTGARIAGKTGTVEVFGQKNNNALFVGYVADGKKPLAIAVVVEEGGSGGSVAAPIAASLLKAALAQ